MSTLEHPDPEPGQPHAPDPAAPATLPERSEPEGIDAAQADGTAQADGSTLERAEEEDPLDVAEIAVDPAKVRHAPRFSRFAIVGGLAGVALGFLLTPFARYENLNVSWHLDPWGLGLVLAATLAPVGVLVGCAIALVSDRRSRRKVKS